MKIKTICGQASLLQDKHGRLKVCITLNGKQFQKRVKTEQEAEQWVLLKKLDQDKYTLSNAQLNDALNAWIILNKADVKIGFTDLARYYLDNAFEGVVTVEDAVSEYLKKCEARVTEGTLRNYRRFLGTFLTKFGQVKVASIKQKDMIDYLTIYDKQPPNWLNAHRALSKFFVECEKYGYCSKNPCHLIEPPRNLKAPNREYLSADDTAKLMRCAEESGNRDATLFLALGLFGGLRPSEAFRMDSKHINLETGYIYISADITKTHSFKERRFKIEPTLMAWLKKYYEEGKPIRYKTLETLTYAVGQIFKKAGVKKTGDVLRHSAATYRYALTNNSAETAAIMGHSEGIAMKHYRGLATKEEAERFFAVLPKENTVSDLDSL
jgi:integrase